MRKSANISPYMRRPIVIYDFATAPRWISLYMIYMRKIWFSFLSVYLHAVSFKSQFSLLKTEKYQRCRLHFLNIYFMAVIKALEHVQTMNIDQLIFSKFIISNKCSKHRLPVKCLLQSIVPVCPSVKLYPHWEYGHSYWVCTIQAYWKSPMFFTVALFCSTSPLRCCLHRMLSLQLMEKKHWERGKISGVKAEDGGKSFGPIRRQQKAYPLLIYLLYTVCSVL
jgi:hypothetical protein